MADYAADIVVSDYLYMKEITVTEKSGEDQTDFPLKLELTSSNFNFSFARSDGLDFRLAEAADGSSILNMWIGSWNATTKKAAIYFKIPSLLANETKTLYAFWGNSGDSGILDINSVGFHLSDHFDDNTVYNNNWYEYDTGNITKYFGGDGQGHTTISIRGNNYIDFRSHQLDPRKSWSIEMGLYMYAETEDIFTGISYYNNRFVFYVPGYDIHYYAYVDGYDSGGQYAGRMEGFQSSGQFPTGTTPHQWGSLVKGFHRYVFGYYLPTETMYFGMSDRDVSEIPSGCPTEYYGDYVDTIERRVNGNTDFTYLRIHGYHTWATAYYLDWVIVRDDFLGTYEPEFDTSNLYRSYEQVNPDILAYGFGADLTHINYVHTTTSGGDPTKLSDDNYGSIDGMWCSESGTAATLSGVDLAIDFGSYGDEITSVGYLHYDSGHETFLNASKLSDEDIDVNDNTYWLGTTASGWACIDFGSNTNNVVSVMVRALSSKLGGMVKDYRIEGSFVYTNEWEHEYWQTLVSGTFSKTTVWQSTHFVNEIKYRYYRLSVLNTYGDDIALQEWKMYNYNALAEEKIVGKLNLKPAAFDSQYLYFPRQITFYGSNNLYNWDTLISTRDVYTPVGSPGWQEFAFVNEKHYYHYKLTCVGNWNSDTGKICIAEWEMRERNSEAYTYRILAGTSNNFNSVWAQPGTTFDDLEFYVTNTVVSHVKSEMLVDSKTFTGTSLDLNVV